MKNTKNTDKMTNNTDKTVFRNTDATRIKPARKPEPANVTRLGKGRVRSPDADKTRVNPAAGNAKNRVSTQSGQHQVLKNRFVLEKVLGVGGMGVVYKAKDRLKVEAQDRDPYVAIKVLSEEFKSHPQAFISLQRESRKTQRISHPNTVKVYDFDRDGDTVFMTMEYMEGKPLDQLIRQYKATGLPRDDAWAIIDGLCSALVYAHAENIVHSDFKPGNVFIINNDTPKIFDFGIARAVASVDSLEKKSGDRTVFDAGSLGALTPSYASYEMLIGETPDVRDDVYALGCVVYEILTGEHPYQKVPADEALKKGLKPKRISGIKKYQWKAILRTLAFKREDRTPTVEQFHRELTHVFKPGFKSIAALFVFLALGIAGFVQYSANQSPSFSENDIRNELEYKIRLDLYKQEIEKLLASPSFSLDWEENIWSEYQGVSKLLSNPEDMWLASIRENIYALYLKEIPKTVSAHRFARAKIMLKNAHRYTSDKLKLDEMARQLKVAENKYRQQRDIAVAEKRKEKIRQVAAAEEKKKRIDSFNLALANVNQQLQCSSRLNMRDFDIAIKKLRSLDRKRYVGMEGEIVRTLAACIASIGKLHPERAMDSKRYAQRIFRKNRIITDIVIKPRDACDISLAGLGARGSRTVCRDKLQGNIYGPSLVVIPGNGSIKPFAMGKYEVSVKEINDFCRATKSCGLIEKKKSLPVTDISIATAKKYLKWLSKKTRQKYRLPTRHEWLYAVRSNRLVKDPNRNCQMRTRGITKGNELVPVATGKQNPWGLVNYIGNVQEWVYGTGRRLVAVGGSYTNTMDSCDITLSVSHSGVPDGISGFRVLREVKTRN